MPSPTAAAIVPVGGVMPGPADFSTTNEKDASGAATVEPNTLGTFARHLWDGVNPVQLGQLLPFPKALGGSGADNPLWPPNIVKQMIAVKQEAETALAKKDYVGALTKYAESVVPIFGPILAHQGNELQSGQYAAVAGDLAGFAGNLASGKVAGTALEARYPLAGHPAAATASRAAPAIQFAQQRGVPLDAATVTDNLAVKGTQALADRSLGGALVATPAREAQAAAMTRVGDELSTQAHPVPTTPEQAGLAVRTALEEKIAGHTQTANEAYDRLRALESEPGNQMTVPSAARTGPKAPVDALDDPVKGELRRIVHEMDAAPYTKYLLKPADKGGSLEHVEGTGGAGAAVYDDILQRLSGSATPSRGFIQKQLEGYLGGGKETESVKAAVKVALARLEGRGSGEVVSIPELPPSARTVLTRGELARTGQDMGFPVDTSLAKKVLQPVYDQMLRQMPITQREASPGLLALKNVLEGPDLAPLSQVDRDLSAIKTLARNQGGLAKLAVRQLETAVTQAAANGGPDVLATLQKGRAATVAKYATTDVMDTLNAEPVRSINALTAPKDAAIQRLRAIAQHVPEQLPVIARAYLEDLLAKPQKAAEWQKLGTETKKILFAKAGQTEALDHFFALTKRISATNVNPSGSGYVASLGAQGAMLWYDPAHGAAVQIGGAALASLLRSPAAIQALTRGVTLPISAPVAIRTAATLNLVRSAHAAGVPLDLPAAAQAAPGE